MLKIICCAGFALCLASQAQAGSDLYAKKKAETLGFAIECGCLKYDEATVVRSLPYLFPGVRQKDSQSLAESIQEGRRRAIDHDEMFLACYVVCNGMNWDSIHKSIRRGQAVTMLF